MKTLRHKKNTRFRFYDRMYNSLFCSYTLFIQRINTWMRKLSIRTKQPTHYQMLQREHIILRVCQAMIAVIVLQSLKLTAAPAFHILTPQYNALLLHITNMCVHLLLFIYVLLLLKQKAGKAAKLLLLISFCSYIIVACWLWRYNVNLQYYFLLSMFISCYIFDYHERLALGVAISLQFGLFIAMHHKSSAENPHIAISLTSPEVAYLNSITHINTWVFGVSCVVCALFIRNILSKNWQQLKKYETTQSQLLNKLFPAELLPPLLSWSVNNNALMSGFNCDINAGEHNTSSMQNCLTMGVVFLDIVDFTILTKTNNLVEQDSSRSQKATLNLQSTYDLFAKYDQAIKAFDAKRVKTNGDQYILLFGLHSKTAPFETIALQLVEACQLLIRTSNIKIRVGAAIGPITCGVFDPNNPNFDIWGETVIRAARLEKFAIPNQIVVDEALHRYTAQHFDYDPPSMQNLKGLGEQSVYPLVSFNIKDTAPKSVTSLLD
jgi:adenylate cyclase